MTDRHIDKYKVGKKFQDSFIFNTPVKLYHTYMYQEPQETFLLHTKVSLYLIVIFYCLQNWCLDVCNSRIFQSARKEGYHCILPVVLAS